jgi:hypothetical protein
LAVRGSIKGRVELRAVVTQLEIEAPAQLEKDLLAGTRKAVSGPVIKKDVQAAAIAKLPKRNGYAPLLAKSVKVDVRTTGGKIIRSNVQVTASGKRENRDLPSLNRGILRAPLFGNRRHWHAQRVAHGLIDEPFDLARDRAVANAQDAADAYVRAIGRG